MLKGSKKEDGKSLFATTLTKTLTQGQISEGQMSRPALSVDCDTFPFKLIHVCFSTNVFKLL